MRITSLFASIIVASSFYSCKTSQTKPQTELLATHTEVTGYDELKTKLVMQPGQTYLSFMKKSVKPGLDSYDSVIRNDTAYKNHQYSALQTSLIKKGAGVAIRIDKNNYIFNVGYNDGSTPNDDIKSGRSYGVGPTGKESDPSDLAYLTELENYLKSEPNAVGDFVEALMLALTNCDTSKWSQLSKAGQIVATDFIAIYTAELDRHLMVNLDPHKHPWEIDLAAATFVSVFSVESGKIMKDGALSDSSIKDWWAKGKVGSGIGETRRDRIKLQKAIAEIENNSQATAAMKAKLNTTDNDVIQVMLEYLASDKAPDDMSNGEGDELTKIMKDYLLTIKSDSQNIVNTIK
jgi:hypothetical protein